MNQLGQLRPWCKRAGLYLCGAPLLIGCKLLGGLYVEPVAVSADPPGQVAVYFSVEDRDESVVALQEQNFVLYENGKLLDPAAIHLRLLSRDVAAEHHTVVLVDLGGPIEEPGARELLAKQLGPFVERLRLQQSVSVYGFDGEPGLYPFAQLKKLVVGEPEQNSTKQQLKAITAHKQKDSSRNLNGAVVEGLRQLKQNLASIKKPIRIGTLVLVTRGPDLAGRVTDEQLDTELDDTPYSVYSLVIGKNDKEATRLASRVGKDGGETARLFENLESTLADVAGLVEGDYNRYYLISYCSPARAGNRTLLLQVKRPSPTGDEQLGQAELSFNSNGFGNGCDAARAPSFSSSLSLDSAEPVAEVTEN